MRNKWMGLWLFLLFLLGGATEHMHSRLFAECLSSFLFLFFSPSIPYITHTNKNTRTHTRTRTSLPSLLLIYGLIGDLIGRT